MTALAFKLDPTAMGFREDFLRHRALLPGAGLPWLDGRRRAAMEAFAKTGIPTRRAEAWKYTDLASALDFVLVAPARFDGALSGEFPFAAPSHASVLLADGRLYRVENPSGFEIVDLGLLDESAPEWVARSLGVQACGADQPLGAASLALMRGGVAIRLRHEGVLNLEFVRTAQSRGTVAHARVLIYLEKGASLRLLESHTGFALAGSLANIGIEIVLEAGAKLEHVRLLAESPAVIHVTSLGASLADDAQYRALHVALGGRLSRLDAHIRLAAPGAEAVINGVAALHDGIADVTTVMDHASPRTASRQLFKNVAGGRGRVVNQGQVVVRAGAEKSNSHQLFKSLLLSPFAEADAKPELEIFADDVVCGHGTAIGDLDSDALFYLRARGIPEEEARDLLIRAFLGEAIAGFADEAVHEALWRRIDLALVAMRETKG
jgi:Fe-S cluster assembly protein SufD